MLIKSAGGYPHDPSIVGLKGAFMSATSTEVTDGASNRSTGGTEGAVLIAAAILLGTIILSVVIYLSGARDSLTMGQRYKMACLAGGGSWTESKCIPRQRNP